MLGEQKTGLGRVAVLGGLGIKELTLPDLLLGLPVHDEALLHGSPEYSLAIILTSLQFGRHVCLSVAVSGDAIRYDTGLIGDPIIVTVVITVTYEPGLDRVCAIIEDESPCRRRRWLDLGFSRRHDGRVVTPFVVGFYRLRI